MYSGIGNIISTQGRLFGGASIVFLGLFMLIMIDLYLRHSTLARTPVVYLYKGFLTFKTNHMQRRAVIHTDSSIELNHHFKYTQYEL